MCSVPVRTGSAIFFFFSSRRRHTRCSRDWSSDVCSSDLDQDAHLRGAVVGLAADPRALSSWRPAAPRYGSDRPVAVRALQRQVRNPASNKRLVNEGTQRRCGDSDSARNGLRVPRRQDLRPLWPCGLAGGRNERVRQRRSGTELELVFVRAGSERNEWLDHNFHARRRKRLRWLWCAQARRAGSRRRAVATTAARGTPTGAVCFATNLCELAMWAWLFCPGMEDRPGWERRGGP